MRREDLEVKTCTELKAIATELSIVGRWDMSKSQLIEAILRARVVKTADENESAKDEHKVDNQVKGVDAEGKVEKKPANVEGNSEKMAYVEKILVGTIVAFRLSNGKVKSAKVARKSTKNRKLKLETDYGAEYIVSYDDIVWVRTGKRWPKGVYNLLRGINSESDANEKQ